MKRQTILDAIAKVKPALSDGKIIEFKGLLLFDGEKLVSYGDEISVSVPLKTEFVAAVKADEFAKLIQKTSTDEISITISEGHLLVRSGKMKAGFSTVEYNPDSIPDLGLVQVGRWFKFPESFIEAIKFCIFSASTNDAYGVLCNLKIEPGRIISSDNFRITERIIPDKLFGLKKYILVPRKIASFLIGFKLVEYALTDSCIHYRDDTGVVFTHRLIVEEYPQVDEYMTIAGKKIDLPKAMISALERSNSIFSNDKESKVTVSVLSKKKVIEVRSESSASWFEEPVDAKYDGEDLEFDASPEHLIQILNHSTDVVIGDNALLFTGKDFRHSVCLIAKTEGKKE